MLRGIISSWRESREAKKAVEAIDNHPVLGTVRPFVLSIFQAADEPWSKASDDSKALLLTRILQGVEEQLISQDPRGRLRNLLANYVIDASKLSVLLSHEFKPHMMELISNDDNLREEIYGEAKDPSSAAEVAEIVYALFHHRNAWLRACNVARIAYGDNHKDRRRDWFGPFMASQYLFQRYSYWHTLKLPTESPITAELGIPAGNEPFDQEKWGTNFAAFGILGKWPEILAAGHNHPRMNWEDLWNSTLGGMHPVPFTDK